MVVLDASAVLALLLGEPGAEMVAAELPDALLGTVNLAEVVGKLGDGGMPADRASAAVRGLGVRLVGFDAADAEATGALRPVTRHLGLSLGDRACLAVARRHDVPALTAERRWPEIAAIVGVTVRLIRHMRRV